MHQDDIKIIDNIEVKVLINSFHSQTTKKTFNKDFMEKTFEELLKELLENWKLQVQEMTDEELMED